MHESITSVMEEQEKTGTPVKGPGLANPHPRKLEEGWRTGGEREDGCRTGENGRMSGGRGRTERFVENGRMGGGWVENRRRRWRICLERLGCVLINWPGFSHR